jgi:SNF2 family DNA or RNA helicase
MEEEFLAQLPESDEVVIAPNILAQLTRLIQLASNPLILRGADVGAKWDAVEELLEFETLPAIVWTSYIITAECMEQRLRKKYRVACLTGQTNETMRQIAVDKLQNGELDVLIAHPGVGKFGLTLTAARTAIYLERSYNGDDYFQSLHRIRRIGTKFSPHVLHLISCGPKGQTTVDHVIDRVLRFRKDSAIKLTSGLLRNSWQNE